MLTTLLAFLIAIFILIFVHELGHFLFAKLVGCRVDEFSVGFKPALWQKQYGETNYVVGSIPVGGYVKIWGENGSEEVESDPNNPRAFYNRPRLAQALVLFGGIFFNIILAWVAFSLLLATGLEVGSSRFPGADLSNPQVTVVSIVDGYPAASSTLAVGSVISAVYAESGEAITEVQDFEVVQDFLGEYGEEGVELYFTNSEGKQARETLTAQPYEERAIIGVELETVGTVTLPWYQAPIEGAELVYDLSATIVVYLGQFLGDLFAGEANADAVSGPLGIASFAGASLESGLSEYLWFIGILSLNLAIFNLLPIPALDGGRLIFVLVESILRRPINPRWFLYINAAGFLLLILLMIVVTFHDIVRLL